MDCHINWPHFKKINNKYEAPVDSVLIYNMKGGKGYVNREDYDLFCAYYIKADSFDKHHTMDLAFAKYHNLILDIDFKGEYTYMDKSDYTRTFIKPTLKSIFDEISCFTYILSTRSNGGIHVHLPEFLISHDDYIHFCTQLQRRMDVKYTRYSVSVDIPTSFTLSTASKPGVDRYKPFSISFVDQNTEYCLPLNNSAEYLREFKKIKFKNKKSNSNSIFRKLIYYQYDQMMSEILRCMMPYVVHTGIHSQKITYKTIISDESMSDYQPVCNVIFDNRTCHILKSNKLNFKSLDWFAVYNFLNNQCFSIQSIETENYAVRYWFKLIKSTIETHDDIFQEINEMIKKDNCYWRSEIHPLKVIMKHDDGLYFLPVFYTLCRIIDKSPHEILNYFTGCSLDPLINRLKVTDERIFMDIAENFTMETILYCASTARIGKNGGGDALKELSIEIKMDSVIEEMKQRVLECKSKLEYEVIIQNIVHRYTPIVIGLYKHSSKKAAKLMWNVLSEHWQEFSNETLRQHIQLIHKRIEFFLERNKKDTGVFNRLQINDISNVLQGTANMERKEIDMDRHKIHIKTKSGILNLLTGHISAPVPEFFMSNKLIGIDFSKPEFNRFYDDNTLEKIYNVITSKRFFRKFLKYLLTDTSDDYFDTLRIVSEEYGIYPGYKHIDSILHFYCHLCKYVSFEYEMVIFMLYVISSIFIATNYYRRFFVFQGNTKNGKSKFFEMIDRTFGNYNHSVRSINLHSSKNGAGPQPELATSLHCCRIISIEEMHGKIDENLIKVLTGNSQVSCRTLYETNSGGIPTAKVFASTNNPPECTATDAFRDRVLAIPFASSFSENSPDLTSRQVMTNNYSIDLSDAIVTNSYKGMFVLSYYNLIRNFDPETGLINLPPVPLVMAEFKEEYLRMTDIFSQFKQYVDVQIIPDTKTMYNHLVSAVRKFLINTKSHLSLESLILKRFDEEFSSFKRETNYDYDYNEAPDEEELEDEEEVISPKKLKLTTIYYENVSIRKEMSTKRF